jgi:hypothetical protein
VIGIQASTEQYEEWLRRQIPLIPRDLKQKHKEMGRAAFPFLRSTFFRWAQRFPIVCKSLMSAPEVLGVGDLHVENFGTWRDIEGRLVWGVNDFDEACELPYTSDLVRLAASALLAVPEHQLELSNERIAKEVLAGYYDGLTAGGRAFVLAEHHAALREMAVERLKYPEKYWDKLHDLPTLAQKPPSAAMKALRRHCPESKLKLRIVHRAAGLGSLGRRRYAGIAQWRGGTLAREAKELAISAWYWAHPDASGKSPKIRYQQLLDRAVRCPDPFVRVRGGWIVRRLAPDCSRIELQALPSKKNAAVLLRAMGWEVANIHLGSKGRDAILADIDRRGEGWLVESALAMAASTVTDWKAWRRRA